MKGRPEYRLWGSPGRGTPGGERIIPWGVSWEADTTRETGEHQRSGGRRGGGEMKTQKNNDVGTIIIVHIVNKAEIHVFLELSCFFDDPVDIVLNRLC